MESVKIVDGVTYRIAYRSGQLTITESRTYWLGDDGSELELTDDEKAERDTSRGLTDD